MNSIQRLSIMMSVAMIATPAYSQSDFGSYLTPKPVAVVPAWQQFKLNPNTRVTLDFRNASIDAVLEMLSRASGIAIVKDPALTGGITLQSPKPQSLKDAFSMLNVVLGLKNYEMAKQDNFLLIRPKGSDNGGFGGFGAGGFGNGGDTSTRNSLELRVYPIKYANATALAKVINDVYAQNAANAAANAQAAALTGPGNAGGTGAAGTTGNTGGGGRFGRGGGGFGGNRTPAQIPTVKASADDYSNSLIVNATSKDQDSIADIISQIDKPTDQPQQSKVFRLKYALATDLQSVVQNILTASAQLGRASTATTQPRPQLPQGGGGFGNFLRGIAANQNTNGSVAADTRTNSLVVTSTVDILAHVTEVLNELDKPETYQSTTYVYVMQNARADVVANLLNQAFGNRTTNGPVGGALSTNGLTQTTIASTASGSAPPTLGTATNRPATNNTGTLTTTNTNSFQNQGLVVPAHDANGMVINVRNLTGQVTLVPNIDTNSIIVVSLPEDRPLVEAILKQMDQIPEQVMIETLVVEASLDKASALGVEYGFGKQTAALGSPANGSGGTVNFGPLGSTTTPQGFKYTLTSGQFQAVVQAIKTDTKFNVLSTPRIFTTNNATAEINISQSLPYVTSTTLDTNGASLVNYAFLDVGIVLTVTPRITSNGYVTMDVTQTANDFVGYTSFNAPIVNQREAQTTVSVQDGQTVVLGGIISNTVNDTQNKVPILGDLPLLGNLFKSTSKTNNKTELLVFMTPHVVRNPDDAHKLKVATEAELGQATQNMIPKPATVTPPAASDTGAPSSSTTAVPAPPGTTGASTTTTTSTTVTTTTTAKPGQGTADTPIIIPPPTVTVITPGAPQPAPTPAPTAPPTPPPAPAN